MIGFNGGLIGKDRTTSLLTAVGVWTPGEQVKAQRAGSWPLSDADPFFANVSLLLHGDGTNGSTTIVDSSSSTKEVLPFGNAQISTTQSKFGGSSIAFDGNGDYISSGSNAAFTYGTGAFTVEFWARFNSISDQNLCDTIPTGGNGTRANGFAFVLGSNGKLNLFSGGSFRGASTTTLTTGTWHHIALVRNATNTFTYYLDGTSDGSFSHTVNLTDSTFLAGRNGDGASGFVNGYLDEYRITKGIERYTADFPAPTAPFPNQ